MGMFKKVAKAVGKMGVLPKAIKETKVGKINPNLVGKPKPGVAPTSGSRMGGNQSLPPPKVVGKKTLPPMPTKVPARGKPTSPGKTVMNSNKTPEQMKVIRTRMGMK